MISLRHICTSFESSEHSAKAGFFGRFGRGYRRAEASALADRPVLAVNDVSLDIPQGSIHGIIGFSGAGKSTLLRNINLLQRPTSGEVWVDGENLTQLSPEELRQRRHSIGMIFQGFNLVNNLTVAANVELSPKFAGVPASRQRTEKVHSALELVDLADKAGDYPARLSGGQKQRVAIARAIATEPEVLLCDEPTSALDPLTTSAVLQYLADINQELNITIVVVTHEMDVIRAIADNVTVMESGRAVEEFATAELNAGTFQPATRIGRHLVEDTLKVDRAPVRSLETEGAVA